MIVEVKIMGFAVVMRREKAVRELYSVEVSDALGSGNSASNRVGNIGGEREDSQGGKLLSPGIFIPLSVSL